MVEEIMKKYDYFNFLEIVQLMIILVESPLSVKKIILL